jgi:hypothetical protein
MDTATAMAVVVLRGDPLVPFHPSDLLEDRGPKRPIHLACLQACNNELMDPVWRQSMAASGMCLHATQPCAPENNNATHATHACMYAKGVAGVRLGPPTGFTRATGVQPSCPNLGRTTGRNHPWFLQRLVEYQTKRPWGTHLAATSVASSC